MGRGAKLFFAGCRGAKKGVLKKKSFLYFLLDKAKEKWWKHGKGHSQKKKDNVFGWLWRKKVFLLKWLYRKIGKHYLCSEGKKRAFSLQLSVFGKRSFFVSIQSHQTLQNWGVSAGTGQTQNDTLGCKSAILGRGLEKGVYSWCLKAVFCWKHYFTLFSAKHSFADMKECNLKK